MRMKYETYEKLNNLYMSYDRFTEYIDDYTQRKQAEMRNSKIIDDIIELTEGIIDGDIFLETHRSLLDKLNLIGINVDKPINKTLSLNGCWSMVNAINNVKTAEDVRERCDIATDWLIANTVIKREDYDILINVVNSIIRESYKKEM